ncbi:putative protein kinase RLK-Pelle-CrRLK1L-1 family [Helianthus debilis subsp. tardiflorus]
MVPHLVVIPTKNCRDIPDVGDPTPVGAGVQISSIQPLFGSNAAVRPQPLVTAAGDEIELRHFPFDYYPIQLGSAANNRDGNGNGSESSSASQLIRFEYPEIQAATKDFAIPLEIGRGGFGVVYLGTIIIEGERVVVAIKRPIPESKQSDHQRLQFIAEYEILPKLRHRNIVSLIGYCDHDEEKILVYKYANNGTIHDHLHKHRTHLSWLQRFKICIDAARGLRYLHENRIIHGDFKPSNVLLHGWEVTISDFGLSKECPIDQDYTFVRTECVQGTFGRMDPIYCQTRQLRRNTDVYAFGVFMLEMLTAKPVVDDNLYGEGMNLVKWAKKLIKKGNLKGISDPDIRGEISTKCLKKYISFAKRCLHEDLKSRPTMETVVTGLESIQALQEKHNRPNTTFFDKIGDMLPSSSNVQNFGISNGSMTEYKSDHLRKATLKFSLESLLGEGSYGRVHRGQVYKETSASTEQGVTIDVAVKKLKQNSSAQGVAPDHWQAEVNFFGNMTHPNIIRLLGYSRDKSKHLLVYEYMSNKSYYQLLFPDAPDRTEPLTLRNRLKTIRGVARGLKHLHFYNYIHFNLRSRNILVSENFNAKLGGLSLAKHCPNGEESHGAERRSGPMAFEDPEYKRTGVVTLKSDVYCFGIVMLEALTGRHTFYSYDKIQLLLEEFNTGRINVNDMLDPHLTDENPKEDAINCFTLALSCVADKPKDRPSIENVWLRLESF